MNADDRVAEILAETQRLADEAIAKAKAKAEATNEPEEVAYDPEADPFIIRMNARFDREMAKLDRMAARDDAQTAREQAKWERDFARDNSRTAREMAKLDADIAQVRRETAVYLASIGVPTATINTVLDGTPAQSAAAIAKWNKYIEARNARMRWVNRIGYTIAFILFVFSLGMIPINKALAPDKAYEAAMFRKRVNFYREQSRN